MNPPPSYLRLFIFLLTISSNPKPSPCHFKTCLFDQVIQNPSTHTCTDPSLRRRTSISFRLDPDVAVTGTGTVPTGGSLPGTFHVLACRPKRSRSSL